MTSEYLVIDMDAPAHVWNIDYKAGVASLDPSINVETLSERAMSYTFIHKPVSDYLEEHGFEIAQGQSELNEVIHFTDPKKLLGFQMETTVTKVGNTAHILVPKRLLGMKVRVSVEVIG